MSKRRKVIKTAEGYSGIERGRVDVPIATSLWTVNLKWESSGEGKKTQQVVLMPLTKVQRELSQS